MRYAGLILAGGAARRLNGVAKPLLPVGGRPMLDRVLAAVADAAERVVVGPPSLPLPPGVRQAREQPPGGGPVAAIGAGLPLVTSPVVALLAADLPFLDQVAIHHLLDALVAATALPSAGDGRDLDTTAGRIPAASQGWDPAGGGTDGAVFVDGAGRRQILCGVWWTAALRAALAAGPAGRLAGLPVRVLLGGLRVREVSVTASGPPPWYDCDRPDDLRRAEEWS